MVTAQVVYHVRGLVGQYAQARTRDSILHGSFLSECRFTCLQSGPAHEPPSRAVRRGAARRGRPAGPAPACTLRRSPALSPRAARLGGGGWGGVPGLGEELDGAIVVLAGDGALRERVGGGVARLQRQRRRPGASKLCSTPICVAGRGIRTHWNCGTTSAE